MMYTGRSVVLLDPYYDALKSRVGSRMSTGMVGCEV